MSIGQTTNLLDYTQRNIGVIEHYIEALAVFGQQPEGGLIRPVFSAPWLLAYRQLENWFKEVGLSVRADAIGNLWGRAEGSEGGPVVVSGSHLDTVKGGGKYDGALGIIAALSAIRFLRENYGEPRRPLEVVALCEEEGSRFSNTFLGSRSIIGELHQADLEETRDPQGVSVLEAARECGFDPSNLASARRDDLKVFLELHIEQGRLLDDAGLQVGFVEAITGLQHLRVTFEGRADHAGTTPIALRSDALVSASTAIVELNQLARSLGHPAVATVGWLEVSPGARNIVPAKVEMSIDLRHSNNAIKLQMAEKIRQICLEAGSAQGVKVNIEQETDHPPAPMSPEITAMLTESAAKLGITGMPMISGAGHDSQIMVEKVPTAMLFVPSRNGSSHSSAEFTPLDQIVPGIAVLAETMYKLAY